MPGNDPPRSTPLPGQSFYTPPPTPSVFLGGQPGPADQPAQPVQLPTIQYPQRKGSGIGGKLVMLLIATAVIGGIAAAVIGVMKAKESVDEAMNLADDVSDPTLSSNDRNALGLSGGEQHLYDGGAAAAVTAALDEAAPGTPTLFTQIGLYGDYAIVTAQDPTRPERLDQYTWRTAAVGTPTPQPDDADAPLLAFGVAEVNWGAITMLAADAPRLAGVEGGQVSYVAVQRDSFGDDRSVVVRIYVSGPRGSAVVQATAAGEFVKAF